MRKIAIFACVTLLSFTTSAQSLKGGWALDSLQAKESLRTQGRSTPSIPPSSSIFENEFPSELTFEDGCFHCTFKDGSILHGGYSLEKSILQLALPDRVFEYKVQETDQRITLKRGQKEAVFHKVKKEE